MALGKLFLQSVEDRQVHLSLVVPRYEVGDETKGALDALGRDGRAFHPMTPIGSR